MFEEIVKRILSDEELVERLSELDSLEDVQSVLKEKGILLSVDQIKEFAQYLKNQAEKELGEDELDNVAGGIIWPWRSGKRGGGGRFRWLLL